MAKFHYKDSPNDKQKRAFSPYLSEDEELVLVTGLSKAYLRQQFFMYFLLPGIIPGAMFFGIAYVLQLGIGVALLALMVGMGFGGALKTFHLNNSNRYLFTTKRVIIKQGVFSVKVTAALYDKITHIEVIQGFIERLFFHHGDIVVNTAGMNKGEIVLHFVDYPLEIKNLLERLINREREQLGMRGGTISAVEGEIIT